MSWRKRLGAPAIISESEPPTQYTQNPQKGGDDTQKAPFEYIEDDFSELRIEKMGECLHGRRCGYLRSEPPESPTCKINDAPVFNLEACPLNHWEVKK